MLDETKSTAKQVASDVEEAAGDLVDTSSTQLRAKAKQVVGHVQETYGDAVQHLRDRTENTPIKALAIASAIGFVVGVLRSRKKTIIPTTYR